MPIMFTYTVFSLLGRSQTRYKYLAFCGQYSVGGNQSDQRQAVQLSCQLQLKGTSMHEWLSEKPSVRKRAMQAMDNLVQDLITAMRMGTKIYDHPTIQCTL